MIEALSTGKPELLYQVVEDNAKKGAAGNQGIAFVLTALLFAFGTVHDRL
jgi:hypothetical protein